jgi:hypothetical protein
MRGDSSGIENKVVQRLIPGCPRDRIGFTGSTGTLPFLCLDTRGPPFAGRTAHGIVDGGHHPLELPGFALGTIDRTVIIGSHDDYLKKLFTRGTLKLKYRHFNSLALILQ